MHDWHICLKEYLKEKIYLENYFEPAFRVKMSPT